MSELMITDRAADKVRELLEKSPGMAGLKLGTAKRGCSGFAYTLEPVATIAEGDVAITANGVTVLIDGPSLPYLEGTVMDFSDDMFQEGFTFNNPNAKGTCGCGESFTV